MDDIAESMDDVLGGPRAIFIRCDGAVVAKGGCALVIDGSSVALEFRRGSEILREEPFGFLTGFPTLNFCQ
jgi:hypothetical protein